MSTPTTATSHRRARPGEARAWLDTHLADFDAGNYTDACVRWPFATNGKGYPCIGVNGRSKQVTRLIVEHVIGEALAGEDLVCHTCDTPRCVNPVHFFRGDDQANSDDKCRKGRHPHGESNARARLTADDVRRMRATYSGRYGEIATFARHCGVDETTIAAIVHRRTWLSVA